jgi:uncharacterized membrane protein YbhN (UPF0104 family)
VALEPEAVLLANVPGDLWDWIVGVLERMGDIPVWLLLLALALKTAESAFIGLTWRNILRAAYPRSGLTFKTSWGASQGGTAINAVTPAQAGTAAMIGIFRTSIPGASVPGVVSATFVQSLFFTGLSVLIVLLTVLFRPRTVSTGSPSNETTGFVAAHPLLSVSIALAAALAAVWLWRRLKPRLVELWGRAKAGGAILRDWRRYAREVALPSGASYGCRIGVNVVFMYAFEIPVTLFTVFLVASSHMLSGLFAITPGGVGQTQALDVVTLRGYASAEDIAAFSITQDAVLTIWNVVLGVAVGIWAFGWGQVRALVRRKGQVPADQKPTSA